MAFAIEINQDVENIPYSDRKKIKAVADKRGDLVDLMSGNPDMEMPAFIKKKLKEKIDSVPMRYTDYYGLPELRRRLSDRIRTDSGILIDPQEELLITHGVQEALYSVMRTILRRGDEVLIPTPHYANYLLNTLACGAKPVFIPLEEKNGFIPRIKVLKEHLTPRTRMLIFSNPNNPLGIVWPDSTVEELARFSRTNNLIVLVDEIYREFVQPEPPISIASIPGMKERTFIFRGFSKTYFMMGLRVGYVIGPASVMHHVRQLHYILLLCPSTLGQFGALAALDCPEEEIKPLHWEFRKKLQFLFKGIMEIKGVTCVPPNGTFYLFPNFSHFGMSSLDLSLKLIEEVGVATLPGTEFGSAGEGYLRLSVCAKMGQIEEGVRRLQKFAEKYS